MNKKTLGIILTALIIGTMIVLMVKSNIDKVDPIENLVGPDYNLLDERYRISARRYTARF